MMKAIINEIKVSAKDYHRKHLEIINVMLKEKLTSKEIDVLASFLSLDEEYVDGYRFNSFARKKVQEDLELSSSSLSNYIKSLIEKGAISKSKISKRLSIIPILKLNSDSQVYKIKLVKDVDK